MTGRNNVGGGIYRPGHVNAQSISRDGTTLRLRPESGRYPGDSANSVQHTDANFVAGNILSGKSIFGLAGNYLGITAGDEAFGVLSNNTKINYTNTWVQVKEFTIKGDGMYRVNFSLAVERYEQTPGTVYGRIRKNGATYGVQRSTTSTINTTYTEDLFFAKEDTCEVWLRGVSEDAGAKNVFFNLRISETPLATMT